MLTCIPAKKKKKSAVASARVPCTLPSQWNMSGALTPLGSTQTCRLTGVMFRFGCCCVQSGRTCVGAVFNQNYHRIFRSRAHPHYTCPVQWGMRLTGWVCRSENWSFFTTQWSVTHSTSHCFLTITESPLRRATLKQIHKNGLAVFIKWLRQIPIRYILGDLMETYCNCMYCNLCSSELPSTSFTSFTGFFFNRM